MSPKDSVEVSLRETPIRHIEVPRPVQFPPDTPVGEVISAMQSSRTRRGCVLVSEQGQLVGIFTERDVLLKVLGTDVSLVTPISDLMTKEPETLTMDDSLSDAIRLMSRGGYRNIPVADSTGKIRVSLSCSDIVDFIVAHAPTAVYNLPPRLHQIMPTPEGG